MLGNEFKEVLEKRAVVCRDEVTRKKGPGLWFWKKTFQKGGYDLVTF